MIIRMSEAGKCPRALSAQLLSYESTRKPKWLETAANEGKWHEDRIKSELVQDGYKVYDEQKMVVLTYPEFALVGHIDGIVNSTDDTDDLLLEVKSMSQYEFDRWMKQGWAGFHEYAVQLTCYLEATGLKQALYVVKNRSSGFVNQSIKSAPLQMGEINQKLYEILDAVKDKQLVSATFDPQDIQCKRCAFVHLCITAPEADSVRDAELDLAVHDWRRGKKLADEGEALMNDAKITLGSFAKSLDTKKFVHDQVSVQIITQHTVSYDKKVLEENIPAHMLNIAKKEQDKVQLRINDLRQNDDQ